MARRGSRMGCIFAFRRIVRRMRFGVTITEIMQQEKVCRRTAVRWIETIAKLFRLERIVGDRPGARWVYQVDRNATKEWF